MKISLILILIFLLLPRMSKAEGIHHNHVAVFLGATTTFNSKHTSPTFGIDYNYYFSETEPRFGIGIVGEMVAAEHTEYIVAAQFALQTEIGLKAFIAPGVLMYDEGLGEGMKTTMLYRLGVSYDFHHRNISFGPALSGDIFKNDFALVYGINVGIGF